MSPDLLLISGGPESFPRVSGDEPGPVVSVAAEIPFSPRERG